MMALRSLLGSLSRKAEVREEAEAPRLGDIVHEWVSALSQDGSGRVVVLSGQDDDEHARLIAEALPNASVTAIAFGAAGTGAHADVGEYPRVDAVYAADAESAWIRVIAGVEPVVILHGGGIDPELEIAIFKALYPTLRNGGSYLLEGTILDSSRPATNSRSVGDYLKRIIAIRELSDGAARRAIPLEDRALGDAIEDVRAFGDNVAIVKRFTHAIKLSEEIAEEVILGRIGSARVRTIKEIPPQSITSRTVVSSNRPALSRRFPSVLHVPKLLLREYDRVVCAPRQVSMVDWLVLPTSFHQPWYRPLRTRGLVDAGPRFTRIKPEMRKPPRLAGAFFHLDNEWAGHYGHFITQDLSKLWGWQDALALHPDLKILISAHDGAPDLHGFQIEMLAALGIDAERIHVITAPVVVDHLITATQAFQNPRFISPTMSDLWRDMSVRLARGTESDVVPDRVFAARGGEFKRACRNARDVEKLFEDHGFTIIYPESMSIAEQVSTFSRAHVIAGYTGSALLNLIFSSTPGVRILIGSESYTSVNEYLISALQGDEFHYFWCEPDIHHPDGGRSGKAFHSDFEFDFDRDGPALVSLLESI
ncbi:MULTISPECIES: glycosyltransferase family 61 protein [unclassified Leifsonia]|uniref:glycosyltransferase family 61 protein n=1 Tax=unclassified Leifsonia TaxID=2663824 RepID=UPI0007126DDC|nr:MULTISPECIES: glycosyltransferase 61 family protein [unclassified Leifsonia]KQX06419.1 hypothetical protein ASC59_00615 [Leifsonia sp. Root1293]